MEKELRRRKFLKKTTKAISVAGFAGCGFLLTGCGFLLKGCVSKKDFDLVIEDGLVFDGQGKEGFKADIGISGDVIKS